MTVYTHERPTWVYVHIDADGEAQYVGLTTDFVKRQGAHRRESPWWVKTAETAKLGPFTVARAHEIETEFIDALQPPFNRHGTARDRRRVTRHWQVKASA